MRTINASSRIEERQELSSWKCRMPPKLQTAALSLTVLNRSKDTTTSLGSEYLRRSYSASCMAETRLGSSSLFRILEAVLSCNVGEPLQ